MSMRQSSLRTMVTTSGGTMNTNTKHKDGCARVFKRYDLTCPRCCELAEGFSARQGWGAMRRKAEEERTRAIRAHDCKASRCGPVCTAFDW